MQYAHHRATLTLAALLIASPIAAQAPSVAGEQTQSSGFSLSPYFGAVLPQTNLLTLGAGATSKDIKLSTAIVVGARLGIMFNTRIGIQADVGYSPGSVDLAESKLTTNTDITTLTGVGKLIIYIIPADKWVWMNVSGGAGAIQHKFKAGGASEIAGLKDGTNVGGVVGATIGVRIWSFIALTGSVEDYLYNASFDRNGIKTSETKQQDIRVTGGIRFPFIGM